MVFVNSWSDLNLDVLSLIIDKLTLRDAVRFGTVCHQWHILFKSKRSSLRSSPWFYMDGIDNKAVFYSIADDQDLKVQVPEPKMSSRTCIGANNGWLITASEDKVHLLRLISDLQIDLPPLYTISFLYPFSDPKRNFKLYYSSAHNMHIPSKKVLGSVLCGRASVSADLTVMMTDQNGSLLYFARAGDPSWKVLNWPEGARGNGEFDDIILHHNMFHTINKYGKIYSWVPSGSSLKPVLISPEFYEVGSKEFLDFSKDNPMFLDETLIMPYWYYLFRGEKHLVESADGLELMVVLNILMRRGMVVKVVRWDKEEVKWKHVESLGEDRMLLVGDSQPFYVLRDEFQKNSIFCSDINDDVGMFCLSNDTIPKSFRGLKSRNWITPSLV